MYASAVPQFGVNNLSGDVDPAALQRDRATYEGMPLKTSVDMAGQPKF